MMCRTIVLVDDSSFDNLYHRLMLERVGGFERILTFEVPEAALAYLAAAADVDLVLLDLNMPSMTGWEFLDALWDGARAVPPVVILSSSSDPQDIQRADAHPAVTAFRTKPLTEDMVDALLAASRTLLHT
jgi:CheY-like chemotaxis protein